MAVCTIYLCRLDVRTVDVYQMTVRRVNRPTSVQIVVGSNVAVGGVIGTILLKKKGK
jgi:hypothetical protein